ncbi:MAG: HD domain-containing protein [Actinomycetota bacterium]|nr:HD domain-containing protein [Actinomycetota bacterium]
MPKAHTRNRTQLAHLTRRFLTSLRRKAPDPSDVDWAKGILLKSEFALWEKMSASDQKHSIAVAKMARNELPHDAVIIRAGLLHDIGKTAVRSGVVIRVAAAIAKPLANQDTINRWSQGKGPLATLGALMAYPQLGASMLREVGSDEFIVRWATEHHLPAAEWTVERTRAEVLQRADQFAV